MDGAHHVIGCRFAQEMRVQNACDDVASTMYRSLSHGAAAAAAAAAAAKDGGGGEEGGANAAVALTPPYALLEHVPVAALTNGVLSVGCRCRLNVCS